MNRLRHSQAGQIRAFQISEDKFFAYVEGGLDRSFYDRILESLFQGRNIGFKVIAAKELPSQTGGKPSLLKYFKFLRREGKLHGEAFGKKFVCAFFADKDIDDLSRKMLRSPHIIYTPTYDLEGHLLSCGDLIRAVADASGITRDQAQILLGSQSNFLADFAAKWKEWTTLCIISQLNSVNSGSTYDRVSAVNPNFIDSTDEVALTTFKLSLRAKLGLSESEFQTLFDKYERLVIREIELGRPLRYFKGKWFIVGLQNHAMARLLVPDASINSLGEKVMTALVSQVAINFATCRCSSTFSEFLKPLENRIR
jgi:hypothetical protein